MGSRAELVFRHRRQAPEPDRSRANAFTLVELLLAVVLALLLAGAVVFNFSTMQPGTSLLEGVDRFETVLRYARAHAAQTGRRVQLQFEEETESAETPLRSYRILLTLESDPWDAPGVFAPVLESIPDLEEFNRLMGVLGSSPPGNATRRSMPGEPPALDLPEKPSPIQFYPDGSCDSAEILLSPRFSEEPRHAVVHLTGTTGAISHELINPAPGESTEAAAPSEGSAVR